MEKVLEKHYISIHTEKTKDKGEKKWLRKKT